MKTLMKLASELITARYILEDSTKPYVKKKDKERCMGLMREAALALSQVSDSESRTKERIEQLEKEKATLYDRCLENEEAMYDFEEIKVLTPEMIKNLLKKVKERDEHTRKKSA